MHYRMPGSLALLLWTCLMTSQSNGNYHIRTIAFYNLENLFDTSNDTLIYDDEYTPSGTNHWTPQRYKKKIANLATVLSKIGNDKRREPPDVIGICEAENLQVLEDLIGHPLLSSWDYGIIHYDSPDERGIDVALLYKRKTFIPVSFNKHRLLLFDENRERDFTRDQLVVRGILEGADIHFIVNHWPSRSGGEERSRPFRMAAAELNRHIIDSVSRYEQTPMIIGMGDFNDNPQDASLMKVLEAKGNKNITNQELFNPMISLYRKGEGSLAYRDQWSLFDQFFMSGNLVNGHGVWQLWRASIYNPEYLKTTIGPFRGYPHRTYSGGRYSGGYSDHFPVYAYLIRRVTELFRED